jgi:hypothetical protein
VLKKISLAVALMSIAGVAAAAPGKGCINFIIFEWCPAPPSNPSPLQAPEIDPSSALAGLSLLAGGLAVLRGRRAKNSKLDA